MRTNSCFIIIFKALLGAFLSFFVNLISLAQMPPQNCELNGILMDTTPDWSETVFQELEREIQQTPATDPNHKKQIEDQFDGILSRNAAWFEPRNDSRRLGGVPVMIEGNGFTSTTLTDLEGGYHFGGLPAGTYTLSAVAAVRPPTQKGESRLTTASKEVKIYRSTGQKADIDLHGESIILRGRIIDPSGQPIEGATVRAEPYPVPEVSEITPPSRLTESDRYGFYEFTGIPGRNIYTIAGFLNGGDPTESNQYSFYLDIYSEAAGFSQRKDNVPRIAPISAEAAEAARHFGRILNLVIAKMEKKQVWSNRKNKDLPESEGNMIMVPDIILEKAPKNGNGLNNHEFPR